MRKSNTFVLILTAILFFTGPLHALQWGELEQEIKATIESLKLGRHSIETKYASGSLTVSGYVSSTSEKDRVVRALSNLKAISEVKDELEIKNEGTSSGVLEESLRKGALDSIKRLVGLGTYEVDLQSEGSRLILNGSAATERDLTRIAEAVRTAAGVRSIDNRMKIAPPPSDDEVETSIWQALQKNEDLDVEGISIKSRGGIVTVTGTRTNHREVDRILSVVNMAHGVREVKSHMTLRK